MSDVTIDDTLRETYANLRGSFESDFTAAEPQEPTEPVEPTEQIDPELQASENPEPTETDEPTEATEPEEPSESQAFRPPWKKAALAEWDKLPPMARAEIERRENDFHKGIEQYKTGAQNAQEWDRAVQPYMATIQSLGVTPVVAAQHLLGVDHQLRYSAVPQKIGMLAKIAGDYGIDVPTLMQGLQQMSGQHQWQQENPLDPRVQQLQAQVTQMQQQQIQAQQQAVTAEHSAIDGEIAAFAADPDHEHFGILQKDMSVLLQNGMAKDLETAYEMAMRQNPQTYQIWLAQQQQEWDAQRKAKVQKAKQAGANVVRPNGRASVPAAQPKRTMEEDIEATARNLGLIN